MECLSVYKCSSTRKEIEWSRQKITPLRGMTVNDEDGHVMSATPAPWAVLPAVLGISNTWWTVFGNVPDETKCNLCLIYTVAVSLEILVCKNQIPVFIRKMGFGLGSDHYNQFFIYRVWWDIQSEVESWITLLLRQTALVVTGLTHSSCPAHCMSGAPPPGSVTP